MSGYLEITNLSHEYVSGNDRAYAFRNITLSLDKGEFLCILGPSGCGKTTLLRAIAGFIKPTAGTIFLDGQQITKPGTHCAFIFQTFDQLLPWKTVLGNVTYPLQVNASSAVNKKAIRENAMHYLDMVKLTKFVDYFPHQLSGGMKQRVAIARALSLSPSLILMDEPFASLDADTRTSLQKELVRIWDVSGATVLFVTHSIIESIALSTRMLAMGNADNSIKLLMDNPVHGVRGKIRTPESEGYAECWSLLSSTVRQQTEEPR